MDLSALFNDPFLSDFELQLVAAGGHQAVKQFPVHGAVLAGQRCALHAAWLFAPRCVSLGVHRQLRLLLLLLMCVRPHRPTPNFPPPTTPPPPNSAPPPQHPPPQPLLQGPPPELDPLRRPPDHHQAGDSARAARGRDDAAGRLLGERGGGGSAGGAAGVHGAGG